VGFLNCRKRVSASCLRHGGGECFFGAFAFGLFDWPGLVAFAAAAFTICSHPHTFGVPGFHMATRRFYIADASKQDIKFLSQPIGAKKDSCKAAFMGADAALHLMQFMLVNSDNSSFQSISSMHLSHVSYANGTITWYFSQFVFY
jgi:hypothetical protein